MSNSRITKTKPQIARSLAQQAWGTVNGQKKLAPGVFAFSCSGHGGIIAFIDEDGINPTVEQMQAARKEGLVHLVSTTENRGRQTTCSTHDCYNREQMMLNKRDFADRVQLNEVWYGEEDCAWATLAATFPVIAEGMVKKNFTTLTSTAAVQAQARETLTHYHTDYAEAIS